MGSKWLGELNDLVEPAGLVRFLDDRRCAGELETWDSQPESSLMLSAAVVSPKFALLSLYAPSDGA